MREKDIQNEIRLALNPYMIVFRINVGGFKTEDGRYITTGVPKGFTDLFGVRKKDGRAVFIEVKNEKGKASKHQENFLNQMEKAGAICGIARSAEQAIEIIKEGI